MTKLLKFSFLPSFYCSLSIWCSRDQLKSLVTVETTPHCTPGARPARCSRLPAPRPKGSRLGLSSSGPPTTPGHTCLFRAQGPGPLWEQQGEKLFPKLASNSDLAPTSNQSEQRKCRRANIWRQKRGEQGALMALVPKSKTKASRGTQNCRQQAGSRREGG